MMLTFLTLLKHKVGVRSGYETDAEGVLENVEGKYRITKVSVRPRVTLKSAAELGPARKVMEAVEGHRFIANSINAGVTPTPELVVVPPAKG